MTFLPGQIVRSKAGRDCRSIYVVLDVLPRRVMVADGRRRTVDKPKAKNPLHLQLLQSFQHAGGNLTDEGIREAIKDYQQKLSDTREPREGTS